MSKVIHNAEMEMNRSLSDYNKFTTYLLQKGSIELDNHQDSTLSTSETNINNHFAKYNAEINSTTIELKTSRYNQLVNEKISENNRELEVEVTEMLEEILSN